MYALQSRRSTYDSLKFFNKAMYHTHRIRVLADHTKLRARVVAF